MSLKTRSQVPPPYGLLAMQALFRNELVASACATASRVGSVLLATSNPEDHIEAWIPRRTFPLGS